ncbi:hypothetical protein D1AOALGA4SA_173 [Olavius algarvensis Delta 1 endosymbiont]|nr:hypothetical protein D1AOALGA4SA_173 [Olavius algarvensis Delta 1 endosymbiont]
MIPCSLRGSETFGYAVNLLQSGAECWNVEDPPAEDWVEWNGIFFYKDGMDQFIEWTHKRKNSHYISMIR